MWGMISVFRKLDHAASVEPAHLAAQLNNALLWTAYALSIGICAFWLWLWAKKQLRLLDASTNGWHSSDLRVMPPE